MAGYPGTPRFGEYADKHVTKTDANGDSTIDLQADGDFDEMHYMYNPSLGGRDMAGTLGGKPGDYYTQVERAYDAVCNHDGFFGGDTHLINLDERKVLDNYIMSTPIVCADDEQHIAGQVERS